MVANPTTPSIEQDAEQVLRTIRTWKVPPSWADLWMHSGLPEHRLSAALRRLLYRTKQITCEGNLTEGWRYKVTSRPASVYAQPPYTDRVLEILREVDGFIYIGAIRDAAWTRWEQSDHATHVALKELAQQGKVRHSDDARLWAIVKEKPPFPPHIDIVVEAIRKSGGTADREAIWGRSPGLTWDEVDRAIEAAIDARKIAIEFGKGGTHRYFVQGIVAPNGGDIRSTPLTTFRRRALIDALLRGHHSITDAVIAAGEAWWQTADPLLRNLVTDGEVNLQWSPPNGDTPGKMHYFKRKEAA